ncbi:MAG: class I SAM-dependent methyltransferase [Candidatus Eisenbacteria bacterium]|nr:class I SAM-dependent methyltransferase [Candidatus Eisenbacteria bacterium]
MRAKGGEQDWFVQAFDDQYPSLYAHRDLAEARAILERLFPLAALEGGRLLDLGCGEGRFLQALAGRRVVSIGLDLSAPLLRRARSRTPSIPLARADMRSLPFRPGSFRWVLLMFTTFGYFAEDGENLQVIKGIAEILEPGGTLLLDTINAAYVRKNLIPRSVRLAGNREIREKRWIDPAGPYLWKESEVLAGEEEPARVSRERLRLYETEEIDAMLSRSGMRVEQRLGDYDAGRFDPERSPRLIVLARLEGGRP